MTDQHGPCCPYIDQSNYLFRPNNERAQKGGPTPNLKYRAVHMSWHAPRENTPKLCLVAARDIEKEEVLVAPLLPLVWPLVRPEVEQPVNNSVPSNKRRRGCSTTNAGGSSSGGLMTVSSEDEDSNEESSNDRKGSWKRRKM